ncbi:MAG: hypothetical protein RLZZ215_1933 [Pseudomonadota bacterium]
MKPSLHTLSKQTGETKFWHIILIVLVVVGLALFINAKGTGFFTHTLPNSLGFSRTQSDNDYQTSYSEPHVANANYQREPEDTDPDIWVNEPNTFQQSKPTPQTPSIEEYNDNLYEAKPSLPKPSTSYDQQFPPRLSRGYYTVQVFTGYNSKFAYDLRTALKKDGYTATHIRELRTRKGVLFKVRIGRYKERYTAFAVRDQLRRRYPKNLNTSFVLLVEYEYH